MTSLEKHIIKGIRLGNVTQVTSTCPWLNSQSLTESFTYDASDQLVSASETQAQSYQLAVTYGNWGKISGYSLAQTDLQNNTTTQASRSITYPTNTNSLGNSQTMFAPTTQNGVEGVDFTFGINGSLRKREVTSPDNYTEYYLFNSAANLKAYSNNLTDFAYYGYNASNTRSYKLVYLNANQWVNGQQQSLRLNPQQAMLYPNAYVNFNQNGEYTKHYYNGSERIASRLGNATMNIAATANARLNTRSTQLEDCFRNDIRTLVYAGDIPMDMPPEPISATSLQQTGTPDDIFYYHTNHLGSTAYVTDNNATITQGFLYAPFGEITTEFDANFGSDIIPKYSFNAKELDEETGMYYYEARYYKPPVFTSRDPMFEKYFWMSPYAYCANNPVKYVDPSGEEIGKIYNLNGKQIGDDGNDDNIVYLCNIYDDIQLTKEQSELYIMYRIARNITEETGLTNDELNLRASLSTLKQAEAGINNPPLGYNSWNGNDKFTNYTYEEHPDDYKSHPGENNKTNRTSAGAYQFLERYYTQKDFSPKNQDMAAVKLMTTKGYDAALSGDMNNFKLYNMGRWTSLEHWSVENLQQKFNKYRADELLGGSNIAAPIGSLLRK